MKKKIFLGGTCNESTWRENLIPMLKINYFNPVVSNWNAAAQEQEIKERETCDYVLYCITPKMVGVYSIAEATTDSCLRPEKTIFCILMEDDGERWTNPQIKSLIATMKLLHKNGAKCFTKLVDIANFVNK